MLTLDENFRWLKEMKFWLSGENYNQRKLITK